MLHKVDFSLEVWRWLYQPIYKRVVDFYLEFGDSLELAKLRMAILMVNDATITLLVKTKPDDLTQILAHCLFTIRTDDEKSYYAFAEQLKVDSGHDKDFVTECFAYGETLPRVSKVALMCKESKYKAYRKLYGFNVDQVLMSRDIKAKDDVLT